MKSYGLQENTKKSYLIYIYLCFLLILLILALQVATQYVAYAFNYQAGLGSHWFTIENIKIYAPWAIFYWLDIPNAESIIEKATSYGQMVFIFSQILLFVLYFTILMPKGNKSLHGSARFATEQEIKTMGYFNGEGVYVGGWQKSKKDNIQRYLRHNGPEHCLCFAPTRSGKGVGLILPTLLSWQGSSITLDIKGENWALTSGWRKSQGHTVLRFDPSDASGNGCSFNPIEELRLDTLFAIQDVQNMAMMIVDPDGKGLSDHWSKAAFAFFSGILLHCCIMIRKKENRSANMQDLTLMMSGHGMSIQDLFIEMVESPHAELLKEIYPEIELRVGEAAHNFIASSASEMQSKAENEASGVISTALVNMSLYRDPIIALNTAKSDFKINDLMNYKNPVDLFLVLSPASIDRVRPLVRLITDMIVRRVCKDMEFKDGASVKGYTHRLLLMLDEFSSLGKLPIIEKAIAYIAGYGGKMYLIVQDITQLNGVYGKDNALMANCHVRIAYAPNTNDTAKVLSEMTGKTTVVEQKTSYSYSKGSRSRSVNISEVARPLLTPDECMRLPSAEKDANGLVLKPGDMLIFTAGQSPIYGLQILYFKDPIFMQRAKMPAPEFTDSLYFPRLSPRLSLEKKEVIQQEDIQKIPTKTVNFEDYL